MQFPQPYTDRNDFTDRERELIDAGFMELNLFGEPTGNTTEDQAQRLGNEILANSNDPQETN